MLWVNPNFEFLNWQFLTRRHEDRFYPINSKLSNSQCALAHNSSLGSAACLSKNSKFLIPNSDGVRRPLCKYRTNGKKLLQNKNRF